ncbi:3-keto-disaccharide hydrolase [Pseudomonas sp. CGJS7]|uniref:3-keto-disaccharide hydrolase n=1 Tax=Pseudomonas sp. CGJS7 TaxID=3109348 RepID=UPI0030097BAB
MTRSNASRLLPIAALCFALAYAGCAIAAKPKAANTLSAAEKREGFVSLFDGRSLQGWHGYAKPGQPISGWEAVDGAIVRTAEGGDLVSDKLYGDFELRIDWKISPGGNSGIFYRGLESEPQIYRSAIEYQVLDNDRHPDGKNGRDRWASALYGLYAPAKIAVRPVGQWNQTRIVVRGDHIEHWLNGEKVVDCVLGSPDWKARVAASKFKDWPSFGVAPRGVIGLQDHGDEVAYRNIRIRPL